MVLTILAAILQLQQSPGGTYRFVACTGPCAEGDSSLVVARGTLVLDTTVTRPETHQRFGCLDLEVRRGHPSFLGLARHELTSWTQRADTIHFTTARTADAGHEVEAVVTDSGFVGHGHSWGAGVAEIHVPDEFVMGRRIGPPDRMLCKAYRESRRSKWLGPVAFVLGSIGLSALVLSGN
jgi:hypothetical protein